MKSALLLLRESASELTESEREISAYVLSNPQETVDISIHELSRRTFCSTSTIIRLCQHLGFTGFKEFRKALAYELALRDQNQQQDRKNVQRTDTLEDIIEKITYQNILSLEDSKNLIDSKVLKECVALIRSARCVYLFGMGASLCAAKDAYLKFLRMNTPCVINEDWHSQLLQARNATKNDVAIVFSYSGNTVEMVECMKSLKSNATPIIAITRRVNTPVSKLADHKLYIAANESIFRSGAMSSRISQLNVIDILYSALNNSQYDQSRVQISKTHIHKPDEE